MVFVFQFDEEFLGRQEAQAQLLKREEKINELEAELQAYRNQVPMLFSLFVWPLLSLFLIALLPGFPSFSVLTVVLVLSLFRVSLCLIIFFIRH